MLILLSLEVGFMQEGVFRGDLQKQKITHAVLIQGLEGMGLKE